MEKENKLPDKIKKFTLLPNSPCGNDLFEGKAQENTALQISNVIKNDESINVIGIEGGWGAGKSNLIKLVKKKLNPETNHVFEYDAWGHQEDLQRRSILEELTESLTKEKKWLDNEKWRKKLKDLLAKTREVGKKTIPSLSIGIIVTALIFVTAPLLNAFTNSLDNNYYKYILLGSPLIILLILFVIFFFREEREEDKFKTRILNTINSMFYVYSEKQVEDLTYETISEDEPSVKNFRDWMEKISDDLIDKKLIIVFDNMDRLPQKKVRELWSSIHVFFAERAYKNIRVIVPFDRSHIQASFKDIDDGENYGDDFINKTFDVVYRVSPPIMSEWKNYFKTQWSIAFDEKTKETEEFNNVVRNFDLLSKEITPRNIIAFINEFVTIKQSVGDSIPDEYISLFIIGKNKLFKEPIIEIISPTYLNGLKYLYENDENLPKYIAALYYQIDPENAIQIIFTDKLKRALDNNNYEDISNISDIPNFYYILENSITQVTNVENAIYALNSLADEEIGNKTQCDGIWNSLYKKVRQNDDHKIQKFQTILLSKIKHKDEYLKTILSGFVSSEKFNAKEYYKSVSGLENSFKGELNVLKNLIDKETSVEDFIEFLKDAKDKYKQYKVKCNAEELDVHLASLEVENYNTVDFIPYLINDYPLEKTLKKIEQLIKESTNNPDLSKIKTLFRLYKELSKDKPLSTKLSDEQVYDLFQKSKDDEEFYYELVAMRIAKLETFNPSYISVFDDVLKSDDDNIVEMIAEKIEYYLDYGNLLLGLKTFNSPLLKLVANKLVNKSYGIQKANLKSLVSSFDDICSKGEIDPTSLIKNLNKWLPENIKSENIKNTASINFIENAIKEKCRLTTHCIDCVKEYLDLLSVEQWQDSFKDVNSYEFRSCMLIENYKIPQNAIDAIKNVLKEIAILTIPIPDKDVWKDLISKLVKQGRGLINTFKTIRDSFIREDNINEELFVFFGDWLFKYADLDEKKESLRKIFPSDILNYDASLQIILENKEKMKLIVNVAKEEAIDFKDTISELLKTNTKEDFIEFAKSIGVKKMKEKEIDEEETDQ